MAINFCPECKSMLKLRKAHGKDYGVCDCGWYGEIGKTMAGEKILKSSETGSGALSSENTFATFYHECPKCHYGKAEVIDLGSQRSNESSIIILKCGKCGHAERKSGAI